jgi:hypothetical protein
VTVVVIDCTLIGAPAADEDAADVELAGRPPLGQAGGGSSGMPSETGRTSLRDPDRVTMSAPSSQTVNPAKKTTTAYVSGSSLGEVDAQQLPV